jgi:DNA-binding NarL/FixJ family response regulator
MELARATDMDALLLDLVLPDVANPAELVRELREMRPQMKVLLVSSLGPDELERAANAVGADAWCHKALTKDDLADALVRIAAQ